MCLLPGVFRLVPLPLRRTDSGSGLHRGLEELRCTGSAAGVARQREAERRERPLGSGRRGLGRRRSGTSGRAAAVELPGAAGARTLPRGACGPPRGVAQTLEEPIHNKHRGKCTEPEPHQLTFYRLSCIACIQYRWPFHEVKTGCLPSCWSPNACSPKVSLEACSMASSSSIPACPTQSKKPGNKIAEWFRQTLLKKPKKMPVSEESELSDGPQRATQDGLLPSNCSPPQSRSSPESCSPPRSRSSPQSPSSGISSVPPSTHLDTSCSSGRWSKDYDVCVCHSEEDLEAAQELVSYLEGCKASLRCFLQLRDATPGGAIVTELCQALSSSHCRVLFITPGFLRDPWCKYQMLQALTEAPGSEGCTIPLLSGLTRAAYPPELRFMYYVDGRGQDGGFYQVKEAVVRYLETLS
nr:toll/interleukin-1 receptor domain-containing adapter protein isoform X1 [Meriones unguiculatus]